jgi:hypothetical protein
VRSGDTACDCRRIALAKYRNWLSNAFRRLVSSCRNGIIEFRTLP